MGTKALTSQAAFRLRKAELETADVVKRKSVRKEPVRAIRISRFLFSFY
jgi:hypothetical protein